MASNFVSLDQAAKILGVSPDDLVEMRSQGKIRGFRDGASWKFKADEVERMKEELSGSDASDEGGEIGSPSDSDLPAAGDKEGSTDSDVALVAGGDSDLTLVANVDEGSDGASASDTGDVSGGSDVLGPPSGSDVLSGSDVELKSPSGSGTGELELGGSDLELGSDAVGLSDEELELGDDEDLVLGGSGVGSDVTLDSADSGINLSSPSDSGIDLASPSGSGIDLASPSGSGIDLAGSSDSGLSLDAAPASDASGSSGPDLDVTEQFEAGPDFAESEEAPAAAPAKDEEFLLSPSDEASADETDSGSQVIALEGGEVFGEETDVAGPVLLPEEAPAEAALEPVPGGPAVAPVTPGAPMAAALPEAEYTVWNVLSLALVALMLALAGLLMTDVVRNIWSWNGDFAAASGLMDSIVSALGLTP